MKLLRSKILLSFSNPDSRDAHYEDVQHGILDANVWDRLCDAGLVPHGVILDEFIAADHELVARETISETDIRDNLRKEQAEGDTKPESDDDSSESRSPPSLKEAAEMVERLRYFLHCTLHEDLATPLRQNLSAIESTIEKLSLQKFRQTNLFQFFKKV